MRIYVRMIDRVSNLLSLPVYTSGGEYVGSVEEVVLDVPSCRCEKLLLKDVSQKLVGGVECVSIPYRWVRSVGDIIVLSYFPEKVELLKEEGEEEKE